MLSYAFKELQKKGYQTLATEEFENIYELYAEILILGINKQLKRGMEKTYQNHVEQLSTIRGKVNISESIIPLIKQKQVVCEFDEYDVNSYKNRIIKTTIHQLLKIDLNSTRRKKLKKLLVYFMEVDLLDIHQINWNIRYNRNNLTYIMIINICYLVITGLLQQEKTGKTRLLVLDEENMSRLYEKFILQYYKQEHSQYKPKASHIPWQSDNTIMLPKMRTDVTLTDENNTLIIDAKYYKQIFQQNYNKKIIHSNNLYQMFTYVKNKSIQFQDKNQIVSGIILYAKTDEEEYPYNTYNMSGNKISVKVLDLNQDFNMIKKQLDSIIAEYFKSYDN